MVMLSSLNLVTESRLLVDMTVKKSGKCKEPIVPITRCLLKCMSRYYLCRQ